MMLSKYYDGYENITERISNDLKKERLDIAGLSFS